jgi:hypothetical protein
MVYVSSYAADRVTCRFELDPFEQKALSDLGLADYSLQPHLKGLFYRQAKTIKASPIIPVNPAYLIWLRN